MGGRSAVAALALVVATGAAGCATPATPEAEDPPTSDLSGTPSTSGATTDASPRTEGPDRGTRERRSREGGARAHVPDEVILRQLRNAAERIAQNLPPAAPTPADIDPGTNRALGYHLLVLFGFGRDQWAYLDALWTRESGWNHLAENPKSGAYGIPQSLPARKMAVAGDDWRTNPETQIRWGLAYIAARYGTPEQAWAHSERFGWY